MNRRNRQQPVCIGLEIVIYQTGGKKDGRKISREREEGRDKDKQGRVTERDDKETEMRSSRVVLPDVDQPPQSLIMFIITSCAKLAAT